jgi:SET domain-containing protein
MGYTDWRAKMQIFWLENILLRWDQASKRYGLVARQFIPRETYNGEYTGQGIPADEGLSLNQDKRYQYAIHIGKDVHDINTQPTAWVDATPAGSILRFMTHSCDPNTEMEQGRCGLHHRILSVITFQDIAMGKGITINYGEDWLARD